MFRYAVPVFIAFLCVVGCDNAAPLPVSETQFIAYCDKFLQDAGEIEKYPVIKEKILKIFENEMKKNPAAFSEFLENNLHLMSKSSPGMAIQMEQYANQAVRDEMARLKQESTVENLVRKEKHITYLEKTQAQLQQIVEEQKKEILSLREISDIKSKKVPVLLVNTWLASNCLFKIKNRKTQEDWEFLLSDSDNSPPRISQKEVLLSPGDYTVKFYTQSGTSLYGQSMFTVEPESPEHKGMKEHYHATVESPR